MKNHLSSLWEGRRGVFLLLAILLLWAVGLWAGFPYLLWCYFLLLLGPAVEDGMSGYISDAWPVLLLLCGLSLDWQEGALREGILSALLTFLLYGLLYVISRKSMGEGDILLAAASAAWLTPAGSLLALWLAAMGALLYVGILALWGKAFLSMEIRFAPFIALGGAMTYGLEKTMGLYPLLAGLSSG